MLVINEFTVTNSAMKNFTAAMNPQLTVSDDTLDSCVIATDYWVKNRVTPVEDVFNSSSYEGYSFAEVAASWDWNNTYPPAMRGSWLYTESTFRYYLDIANISNSFEDDVEQEVNGTFPLEMSWEEWALGVLAIISEFEESNSAQPSGQPSSRPSSLPSAWPSSQPTNAPSSQPSTSANGRRLQDEDEAMQHMPVVVVRGASAADQERHKLSVEQGNALSSELEDWELQSVSRSRVESPRQRFLVALEAEEMHNRQLLGGEKRIITSNPVSVYASLEGPGSEYFEIDCKISNPVYFEVNAGLCLAVGPPLCFDGNIQLSASRRSDLYQETRVSLEPDQILKKYGGKLKNLNQKAYKKLDEFLGDVVIPIGKISYLYRYHSRTPRHTLSGGPLLGVSFGISEVSATIEMGLSMALTMFKQESRHIRCWWHHSGWRHHSRRKCIRYRIWRRWYSKCWTIRWRTPRYTRRCHTTYTYRQHLDFDMEFFIAYDIAIGFFTMDGTLVRLNLLT